MNMIKSVEAAVLIVLISEVSLVSKSPVLQFSKNSISFFRNFLNAESLSLYNIRSAIYSVMMTLTKVENVNNNIIKINFMLICYINYYDL